MNNTNEERLKIAVFVDFDNVAIGVKQSLGRNFDIGTVLEAIKEKGQVISKIAYGDWKRNEDFSRAMTQHAVQMVQRNLTPGGDKNGADIALALDALEMAFTRSHINAYVIVGGDSDFIALVEKLKQYDKTVFVVGGRAFTSAILQKNCHEFISYENLVGIQSGSKRSSGRAQISSPSALKNSLPLIRRALKILSDREVSPQLGLLKSTLLQLDSTFSERDYGVSSFRDFTQKLADAGYVNLKQVDRSLLVELKEARDEGKKDASQSVAATSDSATETAASSDQSASATQISEAIKILEGHFKDSKAKPHWPMYLRTFKQFLRSLQPPFEERQHGITSTYDLVRHASRDGLLRVERNRQGILRILPGERFPKIVKDQPEPAAEPVIEEAAQVEPPEPEAEPVAPEPKASVKAKKSAAKPKPPEPIAEASPESSETTAEAEAKPEAPVEAPEKQLKEEKKTEEKPSEKKAAQKKPVKKSTKSRKDAKTAKSQREDAKTAKAPSKAKKAKAPSKAKTQKSKTSTTKRKVTKKDAKTE
jgi:uncharacterized LabA/DUF88 family protein